MKCGTKKMGAKKGYMMGGMAKKDMPGMKKGGTAKKKMASSKGGMSEMMMKMKGRNVAKARAKG